MRHSIRAALAAVSSLILVGVAVPAHADPPAQAITSCGQTIAAGEAYFARDLSCATGFTLRFDETTSNAFRIDLNGHRLRGPGSGTAFVLGSETSFYSVGLDIENGRVDHWGTAFGGSGGLSVSRLRLDHNRVAVACNSGGCDLTESVLDHNGTGTTVFRGRVTATRTVFADNDLAQDVSGPSGGVAVTANSVFRRNRVGIQVWLLGEAAVTRNVFDRNGVGVLGAAPRGIQDGLYATITGNTFRRNGDGIYLVPQEPNYPVLLQDNVAVRNDRYGIYAPQATDLGGNRAWRNGQPCVGVVCRWT